MPSKQDEAASVKTLPHIKPSPDSKPDALEVLRLIDPQDSDSEEVVELPRRFNATDVGLDLTVRRYVQVHPGARARLPHGIAVAFPPGYFGLIVPRSSTLLIKGLVVAPGTIDPGFRGELQTVVYNPTRKVVTIMEGERLSQLIVQAMWNLPVVEVKALPPGDRDEMGWGSTGGIRAPQPSSEGQEEEG